MALALLTVPVVAFAVDRDDDGLRDAFERKGGVSSAAARDSDGDGVIDAAEDPDGDGLGNRGEQRFGTDPGNADSDGDGLPDGREDHDGDGRRNALEQHQRPLPRAVRPRLERAAEDISAHAPACGVRSGDPAINLCHFGDVQSEITVALVGDSKATMYLPAAIAAAKAEGWHLVTLLKGRCTPIMGTMPRFQREFDDGTSCLRWRNGAFAWLRRNPPDLTVLVFSDDYRLADKKNRKVAGERRIRALERGLTRTVSMLPDASSVVLLADSPKQTLNPVACLKRSRRDMSACVTLAAPASAKRTDAALRKAVRDAGGTYLSLEDRICPYRPCPLVQGDTLIYRDQGHLTVTFTRLLAPSLRAELASLLPPDPIDEPPQTEPASSAAPDEAQP